MTGLYTIYRFRDNRQRLLYVGLTENIGHRITQHARDKPWWPEVAAIRLHHAELADRSEAEWLERIVIETENPKYNVVHNGNAVDVDPPVELGGRYSIQLTYGSAPLDCMVADVWFSGREQRPVVDVWPDDGRPKTSIPWDQIISLRDLDKAQ